MDADIEIRESRSGDAASLADLYLRAFPDEDLVSLVEELLAAPAPVWSFVAHVHPAILGHAVFTICGVTGRDVRVALLGPLAVAPGRQKQGIGSALVREGLHRLESADVTKAFVLGDPAYYRRFGFQREERVTPPYSLPPQWREAWQSVRLLKQHAGSGDRPVASGTNEMDQSKVRSIRPHGAPDREAPAGGKLAVPPVWCRPALWAP